MLPEPRHGYVALVLHAHMPYVLGYGRWPHGVDWLNEAAAEAYIPLINVLGTLAREGAPVRVTLGTSPVLAEQLADPRFADQFNQYLQSKEAVAGENAAEFGRQGRRDLADLAARWRAFYAQRRADFNDRYGRDLVGALRDLQDRGIIELATCAATHGYLPLLGEDGSIRAQLRLAVKVHKRHYGRPPRGMWLPECAYRPRGPWVDPLHPAEGPTRKRPGLEEYLADEGLEYFIVDAHLLHGGEGCGDLYVDRYAALRNLFEHSHSPVTAGPDSADTSIHRAYLTSSHPFFEKTVAFFTRDGRAALQVWSNQFGYPGDPQYLEFHKQHFPGGLRYWRVTGRPVGLEAKEPYRPSEAQGRLEAHVHHYVGLLREILREEQEEGPGGLSPAVAPDPQARDSVPLFPSAPEEEWNRGVVCVAFDAELFGHWWHEGADFLARLLARLASDADLRLTTLSEELDRNPPTKVVRLREGSWGKGGNHVFWLNEETRWTWELIHEAEQRMAALVLAYGDRPQVMLQSLLAQAGRALLLLQASDWQFIISARNARDYAAERIRRHCVDFNRLAQLADKMGQGTPLSDEEAEFLRACQERDRLFDEVDASLWK